MSGGIPSMAASYSAMVNEYALMLKGKTRVLSAVAPLSSAFIPVLKYRKYNSKNKETLTAIKNSLNNDAILNPISTPIFTTTYKIYVYGGGGNCYATDSVKVTALKQLTIPNVFSPNGDNIHDTWDISFLNDYPNCKIEVFNRNGQIVLSSLGYGKPWDGRVNGIPLPIGTYYYIIELNKNGYTRLSGSVTILR